MKIIAFIPARSGSKSVPNKNIKKLNERPLINYAINKALSIKLIDNVIVSSDSDKILKIYKQKNKKIIFLKRPKNISDDTSPTELALSHALDHYLKTYKSYPDIALTIEPTSPFRSRNSIIKAIKILKKNLTYDSVISVVEETSNFGKINDKKFVFNNKISSRRRQDRTGLLYKETGVVYATRVRSFIKYNTILGKKIYPLVVTKEESLDINDKFDFRIAEFLSKIYL